MPEVSDLQHSAPADPHADFDEQDWRHLRCAVESVLQGECPGLETSFPPSRLLLLGGSLYRAFLVHLSDSPSSCPVVVIQSEGCHPVLTRVQHRFGLTRREAEVAVLLSERKTNKEIARLLHVSGHTARRHTEKVLLKLGVARRADVQGVIERLDDPPAQSAPPPQPASPQPAELKLAEPARPVLLQSAA